MKYNKIINLKNGKEALLRNGEFADGEAVFVNFNETHAETDYLLSYPDENSFDAQQEAEFLKEIGCTTLQGFLFAKPLSLDEIFENEEEAEESLKAISLARNNLENELRQYM